MKALAAAHLARLPVIERMIDGRIKELMTKMDSKGEYARSNKCEMYLFRQVLEWRLRTEYDLKVRRSFRVWMERLLEAVQGLLRKTVEIRDTEQSERG